MLEVGATVLVDPDPSELLGIKRTGVNRGTYARMLRRDPCAYCGNAFGRNERAIDHIHPRSLGGVNDWSNYTGACEFCNGLKLDDSLLEFLLRLNVEMPECVWDLMSHELKATMTWDEFVDRLTQEIAFL